MRALLTTKAWVNFYFLFFLVIRGCIMGKNMAIFLKMECLQEWTLCFRKSPPLGEEKLPDFTFPQTTLPKSAWLFMIMNSSESSPSFALSLAPRVPENVGKFDICLSINYLILKFSFQQIEYYLCFYIFLKTFVLFENFYF